MLHCCYNAVRLTCISLSALQVAQAVLNFVHDFCATRQDVSCQQQQQSMHGHMHSSENGKQICDSLAGVNLSCDLHYLQTQLGTHQAQRLYCCIAKQAQTK